MKKRRYDAESSSKLDSAWRRATPAWRERAPTASRLIQDFNERPLVTDFFMTLVLAIIGDVYLRSVQFGMY